MMQKTMMWDIKGHLQEYWSNSNQKVLTLIF